MKLFAIILIGLCCVYLCESTGGPPAKVEKPKNNWKDCGEDPSVEGVCLYTKWRMLLTKKDGDNDSKLTLKDMIDMGNRYADNSPGDDISKNATRAMFISLWSVVYNPSNSITELTYDQVIEIYAQMGRDTMLALGPIVGADLFKSVSPNDDFFDLQEFKAFYNRFSNDPEEPYMEEYFNSLANPDNLVSKEALIGAFLGFAVDVGSSPNHIFWGALPPGACPAAEITTMTE